MTFEISSFSVSDPRHGTKSEIARSGTPGDVQAKLVVDSDSSIPSLEIENGINGKFSIQCRFGDPLPVYWEFIDKGSGDIKVIQWFAVSEHEVEGEYQLSFINHIECTRFKEKIMEMKRAGAQKFKDIVSGPGFL